MDRMMSLFDYLGHAAGGDLGKKVYLAAQAKGINHSQREVSNPKYTGMVMIYPESFLEEYFSQLPPPPPTNDGDDDGEDLPF